MKPKHTNGPAQPQPNPKIKRMLIIRNNKRAWAWENGDGREYPTRAAAEAALS